MGMSFGTRSSERGSLVEHEVNCGGATHYRLQQCLGLKPEPDGRMELDAFAQRLDATLESWGPDNPGYPDAVYVRDYGRGPDYVLGWLDQLYEMCRAGRQSGHRYVVWF